MRRAGRIGIGAQHHAEAVWAILTLAAGVLLVAVIAMVGVQPPALPLAPARQPSAAGGGGAVIRGGSAALQRQVQELQQRANAAQAEAAQAAQGEAAKAAELHKEETKQAALKARLHDEASDLSQAKVQLQKAEADASAEVEKRQDAEKSLHSLEASISSSAAQANKTGSGTSASKVLKQFEANLAQAQVRLAKAEQTAKDQAEWRQAAEAEAAKAHTQMLAQEQALEAQRNATRRAEERLKQAEAALAQKRTPSASPPSSPQPQRPRGGILRSLTSNWLMAFLVAAMGVLSVLGPSSFVRIFWPVVGSGIGGLMAAGFFQPANDAPSLIDGMELLVDGAGTSFGYFLWLMLVLLGIARWVAGVECSLWEFVDNVVMNEQDPKDLSAPLLDSGETCRPATNASQGQGATGRAPLPPPNGPPS